MTAKRKEIDPDDPWTVLDPPRTGKDWKDKTASERFVTLLMVILKIAVLLGLLYLFICSLDFLSNAFRLLGGKAAGGVFRANRFLNNPVANLMIGVLATVLLQSSSTTTSIVVTMVAAGLIEVRPAIFLVMGANIGTSVTNTIVSLGHVSERNEFRRAFAGATVHDMFNWLAVICLLPIEWLSGSFGAWKDCGLLCQFTGWIVRGLEPEGNEAADKDLIKVITKPFTSLIIQIDKKVLTNWATMNETQLAKYDASLVKHKCSVMKDIPVAFTNNVTGQCEIKWETQKVKETCVFMFEYIARSWNDVAVGICLLVLALFTLCVCLVLIVKLLHSLLEGKIAIILKRFVNSDFPGCAKHFTGYLAILLGAGLTMLVQSSSIFTSAITPLVGVGVLHLDRMYPLTLGANIGTTFTAILAALASDASKLHLTLQVALCHLFFNIFGILIWYPVPFMRKVPISLAKKLGNTTAKYRWFALVYLFTMFFLFPAFIFGLSVAGTWVIVGVGVPLLIFFIIIIVINRIQKKAPHRLPKKLQTWDFLPKALHSLEPYDRIFVKIKHHCCCKSCRDDDSVNDDLDKECYNIEEDPDESNGINHNGMKESNGINNKSNGINHNDTNKSNGISHQENNNINSADNKAYVENEVTDKNGAESRL